VALHLAHNRDGCLCSYSVGCGVCCVYVNASDSGKVLLMGDAAFLSIADCATKMTDAALAEWLREFFHLDEAPQGEALLQKLVEALGLLFVPCSCRVGFDQRVETAYYFFDVGTCRCADAVMCFAAVTVAF
jgi:hypothetical protein